MSNIKLIRLSKSIIDYEEVRAVERLLIEDGYLGMGAEVGKFETEIANYIGVPSTSVVCVNSGTAALHLSVESILNKGDEILVPSFTFLSSFQAISAAGVIPVACDVYGDTFTLDIEDAERRITARTKAVMPVHYASNPGDLDKIYDFANKFNLRIIEDAAHAFGCSYKQKKIGSFGDIVCFSFDGIKNITSGEGGAIITKDSKVLELVKDARLLGIEKDSDKRYNGLRSWEFDVKHQGYRYHMSNIFAAIGRVQLSKLETVFAPKRIALYQKYKELLFHNKNIRFQTLNKDSRIISHILPIRILNNKRDKLREILQNENIQTGIHYKPNHLLSYYGNGEIKLNTTEQLYSEIISLPLHPELSISEVEYIAELINKSL